MPRRDRKGSRISEAAPVLLTNGLFLDSGGACYSGLQSKKMAPEVGFEPTTNRLTADRSTAELLRN